MAITVESISTNWSFNTDTEVLEGEQYRLRAGAPMPTMGGGFVIHTFMAEANKVLSYLCTEQLPGSHQFRGQGGSDNYISANFSRLNIAGGKNFQGKIVKPASPQYIDEGGYGFN